MRIAIIPKSEFDRVRAAEIPLHEMLSLVADMCRVNTLAAVKRAGSGHLGTSFSAMDIVVWLYFAHMNTLRVGIDNPARDIFFSSKGHDVPGLYSVLYAGGILPKDKLLKLRRYGGLDGHPDVGVIGIEANSGSLGMGISKGKGIAWAKRESKTGGHVYVMTGDGELQEGQNYEALQSALQQNITDLTVIVDNNKVQSDKPVVEIVSLGDLESKLRSFGWHVARCDGHNYTQLAQTFAELTKVFDKPKVLIADTIKGRGVSFMEHPRALKDGMGYYKWHAGAPDDDAYTAAFDELIEQIRNSYDRLALDDLVLEEIADLVAPNKSPRQNLMGEPESVGGDVKAVVSKATSEFVAAGYGKALVELAAHRKDIVVLDGDLAADCRVREFELTYPDRFIENGIAEQDMVSMAGGLARHGYLPVVNSFASFLSARANEQIYNNASEKSKIIYACHYAGLIPAGPGKSHQSIRDISLFRALPGCTIFQPCSATEARLAMKYFVEEMSGVGVMRMNIGPSPQVIQLPENYQLVPGKGFEICRGANAILFGYGPVMLNEALVAAELLTQQGIGLTVVNMPWLNLIVPAWLQELVSAHQLVITLDDHSLNGGLGDTILSCAAQEGLLLRRRFEKIGVDSWPACGAPLEALKHHRLDGESLAIRIIQMVSQTSNEAP